MRVMLPYVKRSALYQTQLTSTFHISGMQVRRMAEIYGLACPITKELMQDPVVASDGERLLSDGSSDRSNLHIHRLVLQSCSTAWQGADAQEIVLVSVRGEYCLKLASSIAGYTYERAAIQKLLECPGQAESPITHALLPHKDLVPNLTMRSAISLLIPKN